MPRCTALLLIGIAPLAAQAGLAVTLFPSPDQCPYEPGQIVHIDVYGQITPNTFGGGPASVPISLLQFDFSDTDSAVAINMLTIHPATEQGDISFWNFGTTPLCAGDSAQCGADYFIDDSLTTDNLLKITYTGLSNIETQQVILYQNHPTLIGMFEIVYPTQPGTYVVDLLNANEIDSDLGAELRSENIHWRASQGEITGGRLSLSPLWCPEPTSLLFLVSASAIVARKKRNSSGCT